MAALTKKVLLPRGGIKGCTTDLMVIVACLFLVLDRTLNAKHDAGSSTGRSVLQLNHKTEHYESKNVTEVAPPCTKGQRDAILERFWISSRTEHNPTPISQATRCPEVKWLESYFGQHQRQEFLIINVGCNKGNDAIHMARILSRNEEFSTAKWQRLLELKGHACPLSQDTAIVRPNSILKGKVHCIEAMPSTFKELQKSLNRASLVYKSTLVLHNAAISNITGSTLFPDLIPGAEYFSLSHCTLTTTREHLKCTEVPMFSLDHFLSKQNYKQDHHQAKTIDMLLIDAEGFDYEVLLGATETLKKVRYLTFEVGQLGNWPSNSLDRAVHHLLNEFVCYWVGRDQLWRITECVDSRFAGIYENMKTWSNVACIHRGENELLKVAEALFFNTIQGPTRT